MFFRIDGDEAQFVLESFGKLLEQATKACASAAKKWDWEALALETECVLTEEEIKKHQELQKLEYEARLAKAKAEIAESLVRSRRASLQQQNLNRALHKPKELTRSMPERRVSASSGEGKKEGQSLTHNLGEKLKSVVTSPS